MDNHAEEELIKYAGKVKVRGMIRRVWRTRFIEIDSVGILRYYESTNESDNDDLSDNIERRFNNTGCKSIHGTPKRSHISSRALMGGQNQDLASHIKYNRTISPEMQAFSLPILFPAESRGPNAETQIGSNINAVMINLNDEENKYGSPSKQQPEESTQHMGDDSVHDEGIIISNHTYVQSNDLAKNVCQTQMTVEDNWNWDHVQSDSSGALSDVLLSADEGLVKSTKSVHDLQTFIQSQSHHIHGHRPKATILVKSVRLIDPNSLRDMHLGLPKNKYGFTFHGCSIFSGNNLEMQTHVIDNMCQSKFHFEEISDMSRDYLCAVNNSEEAEYWVKALSWASTASKEYERKLRLRNLDIQPDDKPSDSMHHMGVLQGLRGYNKKNLLGDITPDDRSLFMGRSQSLDSIESTFDTVMIKDGRIKNSASMADPMNPIIVIPQVRKLHYTPTWKRILGVTLDIQAEIHVLVTQSFPKTEQVYEYSIYRSIEDMEKLFLSLKANVVSSNMNELRLLSLADRDTHTIKSLNTTLRDVIANKTICDSEHFKEFLLLNSHTKPKQGETLTLLTDGETKEDFAKKWINDFPLPKYGLFEYIKVSGLLLLREERVEYTVTCLLLYMLYRLSYWWWCIAVLTVTFRLDFLIIICYLSFLLGQRNARKSLNDRDMQTVVQDGKESAASKKSSSNIEKLFTEDSFSNTRHGELRSSSSLSQHNRSSTDSIWSRPDESIFKVRGATYLKDRTKIPSGKAAFDCLNVEIYLTDNPERNISRHDFVFDGKAVSHDDLFIVNFLLPFANFFAIFRIPPLSSLAPNVADVWRRFVQGDQQYRDSRLKMLSVVVDGSWIVKKAVGPGSAPALLGKVIPLQYFFSSASPTRDNARYEVDIIITASRIANAILNVVKGHTKTMSIAFAFIIEGVTEEELPETVLCSFQIDSVHLEQCPQLPDHDMIDCDDE